MTGTGARHRLSVIFAADAAGCSRLMADDDVATVAALDRARDVFRQAIARHGGRTVDMAGDSVLAVFETTLGAVQAGLDVQVAMGRSTPRCPVRDACCSASASTSAT